MSDSLWPYGGACQAPLSMGFFRQEYWSGLPFSLPGNLPSSGIKPTSPASLTLSSWFFTTEPPGKPQLNSQILLIVILQEVAISSHLQFLLSSNKDTEYLFCTGNYFLINYFWLHWVFVATRRLSLVVVSRGYSLNCGGFSCGSPLVAQTIKSLPAMQETWVWSLGR